MKDVPMNIVTAMQFAAGAMQRMNEKKRKKKLDKDEQTRFLNITAKGAYKW